MVPSNREIRSELYKRKLFIELPLEKSFMTELYCRVVIENDS